MLGAPRREGIVAGYALAATVRFLVTGTVVTVAALISGMHVDGDPLQLLALLSLALLVNLTATLWGSGIALRFQTLQAGPVMQIPVFLILFMAPVYVPLDLIKGWVNHAASYNPLTAIIEAGRGFLSGEPETVGLAYLAGFGLVAIGIYWALTGLRRAERGE
jgi:ABC-2 type transport system permease protein